MILTIRHKGLRRLYEDDDARGVAAQHVPMLRDILAKNGDERMLMKNPPHPGGFVRRQCIEPLGLSIRGAAAALGVRRTALSDLVNEKRGISPEMAVRLSKVFGGSAESWLAQQAQYDLAHVRTEDMELRRLEQNPRSPHGTDAASSQSAHSPPAAPGERTI